MTVSDKTNAGIFRNAVEALKDPLPQRVWSVIVSLLGDLAQGEGDQISGVALTEAGRLMGIRAEAIRVALHRLRKDGWIESLRDGRSSMHQLTAYGREDTIRATPKIYSLTAPTVSDWYIVCTDPDADSNTITKLSKSGVPLSRNSFLISAENLSDTGNALVFRATSEQVPDWAQMQCCPRELKDAAASLEAALHAAHHCIQAGKDFDALQRVALRTLIVHRWRRVALRTPAAPACFFPMNWRGNECRLLATELLKSLPPPSLHELEAAAFDHRSRASENAENRFKYTS